MGTTATLAKHYEVLTGAERFAAVLEAMARGDAAEEQRLEDSCPRGVYEQDDPAYRTRMHVSFTAAALACASIQRDLDVLVALHVVKDICGMFRGRAMDTAELAFFCGWHAARDAAGVDVHADDAEVEAELAEFRKDGVWPLDNNVIVRHLRIRPGDASGQGLDAVGGRSGEDIIIDHCSMSWSIDECVSFYGGVRNLTVQWCLMSESLYQSAHAKGHHGFGGIWGGQNASWHHNLLAHHSSRNPRVVGKSVGGQLVDVRNNVFYNWGYNSTYGGDGDVRVNLVNNVYKPGPATRTDVRARVANPSQGTVANNWWIAGNLAVGSARVTADNWMGVHPAGGISVDALRAKGPFEVAPVTTQSAEEAFELVLKQAGATLPKRDPVDARVAEEARAGTARFGETYDGGGKGIIDSPKAVGGWPDLRAAPAAADADGDGTPDEWEARFKLDPKNPSDRPHDANGDGYTNLEEYLNGTDPTVFVK